MVGAPRIEDLGLHLEITVTGKLLRVLFLRYMHEEFQVTRRYHGPWQRQVVGRVTYKLDDN